MTTIRKSRGKWESRVLYKYAYHIIGYYNTRDEAVAAYNNFNIENKLNRKIKI